MLHTEYQNALDDAAATHAQLRLIIDLSRKNRALAIYYLIGASISQCYLAIDGWGRGNLNTPLIAKRMVDEILNLVILFAISAEDDRRLSAWFSGKIIGMPNLNSPKNKELHDKWLQRSGWNEEMLQKHLLISGDLSQEFSKGAHPSIESVRFNTDRMTGEFDYSCRNLARYPMPNFDFAHYIIIPILQTLLMVPDILPIPGEDYGRLRNRIDEIQRIARESLLRRRRAH